MVSDAKHVLTCDSFEDGQVLLNNETVGVGVPQAAVDLVGEQLYEAVMSESGYSINIDGTEYIVIEGLVAPKPTPYARLYRRVISDTSYLVDPDGKLVVGLRDGDGYALYADQSGTYWHWADGSNQIDPMIEACGGACLLIADDDGIYYCGVQYDTAMGVLSPEVAEWVNPRSEAILYAKEYVSGHYVLADNFGRGLRFETTVGNYSFIELDKQGDDWDFSQTVSSIEPAPSVDIESEWTDANTKAEFTLGGTTYNVDTMKFENPAWITPNNIVEFI